MARGLQLTKLNTVPVGLNTNCCSRENYTLLIQGRTYFGMLVITQKLHWFALPMNLLLIFGFI